MPLARPKEIGIKHVSDTRRSFLAWYGAEIEEEQELFGGDGWPYNIRDNLKELETMTRYAELAGDHRAQVRAQGYVRGDCAGGESI